MNKKDILKLNTCGYLTLGIIMIEVKDVEYGIDDYLLCVSNTYNKDELNQTPHRLKIRYTTSGKPYVIIFKQTLYL